MSKRQRQIDFDLKHYEFMTDAAMEVEVNRDKHGLWQVRCYDSHGFYIGGISSVKDFSVAQREAYKYAIAITQPI